MPDLLVPGVAAQAHSVGLLRRTLAEGHDLLDVATARHVKAAIPVTIFAFHSLLFMEGVLEILGNFPVATRAGLGAH
jgi:hypothetical protein